MIEYHMDQLPQNTIIGAVKVGRLLTCDVTNYSRLGVGNTNRFRGHAALRRTNRRAPHD